MNDSLTPEDTYAHPYFPRTLLPEPPPATKRFTIISADDHLMESPTTFTARVPRALVDAAPRFVEHEGTHAWLIDGTFEHITSGDGMASWPVEQRALGPARLDEMRPGVADLEARLADMDHDGVLASVLFPSIAFGFAGQRLSTVADEEAGLAFVRAYNDWLAEEVMGRFPTRYIPSQVTWFRDVSVAAQEVRRNAERGFRAVLFSENPEKLGWPSLHTRYWDPFFAACEETGTVVNIHLGSSSHVIKPSSDSPLAASVASVAVNPILAAFDWVYSEIPVRFPQLRIALSEGGIDWVPMVISRLDAQMEKHAFGNWTAKDVTPTEVFLRNFWFSALYDTSAFPLLQAACPGHVMLETDYPHGDATWPDTQEYFARRLAGLDRDAVAEITHRNAARLYRYELPPDVEAMP